MIFDHISRCDAYMGLGDAFRTALSWLKNMDPAALAPGRYDIDGDRVYAMVQNPRLRPWEEGVWETHRRYADIQMVISGGETIGFCDLSALADAPYDEEKDLTLYPDAPGNRAVLAPGDMMILFPWDAHRPGIMPPSGDASNTKVVVKVRI